MSNVMQFKARMKKIAFENHIPAQVVLQNFMLERLLERIAHSKYCDYFVIKGGMLITSIVGIQSRTTMDLDATICNYPLTEESIFELLSDICRITLNDDTEFKIDHISQIRADDEYGGYRVSIISNYQSIIAPLKVDITTGDVITPEAKKHTIKSIFTERNFDIWAYPLETILAEKIETILRRSVLNTRPRDYYDVYILLKTRQNQIDIQILKEALSATSQKRFSSKILDNYSNIIQNAEDDTEMQNRWKQYSKNNAYAMDIEFNDILQIIEESMRELFI